MRLIDADELLKTIDYSANVGGALGKVVECVKYYAKFMVASASTIEPERKKGKWIGKDLDAFRKYEVICSECKARYVGNYDAYDEPCEFNFCPNCGCEMER